MEHVKLEASAAEEQNLLYEQSDLRIEVVELTRLAAIKVGMCVLYQMHNRIHQNHSSCTLEFSQCGKCTEAITITHVN